MACPSGNPALTRNAIKALWVSNGGPIAARNIGNRFGPVVGSGSSVPIASIMAEISLLESGWCPDVHVTDADDDSYGLWQINLKPGANSFEVLKQHVTGLNVRTDLLKPAINARAAVYLFNQEGENGAFHPWDATASAAIRTIMLEGGEGTLPGGAVGETLPVLTNPLAVIGDLVRTIMNPTFWKFVGLGALGILITVFALTAFTDSGQQATSTATSVATKGVVK